MNRFARLCIGAIALLAAPIPGTTALAGPPNMGTVFSLKNADGTRQTCAIDLTDESYWLDQAEDRYPGLRACLDLDHVSEARTELVRGLCFGAWYQAQWPDHELRFMGISPIVGAFDDYIVQTTRPHATCFYATTQRGR